MNKRWTSFLVVCFVSVYFTEVQGQSCVLPEDLQNSSWVATGVHNEGNIEFGLNTMTGYDLWILGEIYQLDECVWSAPSDGIYVFRLGTTYYDPVLGVSKRAYVCMRLKKITDNLYSFYILADEIIVHTTTERYLPLTSQEYSAITSTCELCQATSPETDDEYSLLTRAGSTDQVPSDYMFMNCPCGTPSTDCPPAPTTTTVLTTTTSTTTPTTTTPSTTSTTVPTTTVGPTTCRPHGRNKLRCCYIADTS